MSTLWIEWVVEAVDTECEDIIDTSAFPTYAEALRYIAGDEMDPEERDYTYAIVLCRTSSKGRGWAYMDMETHKLPEHFEDAMGSEFGKVPARYHKECSV